MANLPKLGTGARFAALVKKFASRKGTTRTGKSREVKNPAALAASIGRKKYGKKRFQALAAKGRRNK